LLVDKFFSCAQGNDYLTRIY